jgi:two-component system LytT family response regulator
MITAISVDDNPTISSHIADVLTSNFPEIELLCQADSVESGIAAIQQHQPDLVMLDIELSDGTGFDILKAVKPHNFKLIFITGHNDFAIKAIKYSAIDYILKPINDNELIEGIEKAVSEMEDKGLEKQLNTFFEHYEKKTQSKKIVLKTSESLNIIDIHDITHCKSDNTYTTFYLQNGDKILVSQSIKNYEAMLADYSFFRPHQSYLVNMNFVERIDKADGGFLVMKQGAEIPVSVRRKQKLLEILSNL